MCFYYSNNIMPRPFSTTGVLNYIQYSMQTPRSSSFTLINQIFSIWNYNLLNQIVWIPGFWISRIQKLIFLCIFPIMFYRTYILSIKLAVFLWVYIHTNIHPQIHTASLILHCPKKINWLSVIITIDYYI